MEPCKSTFLRDEPSGADALGAHDRVASVLYETIRSTPQGYTIGLMGAYGSGKSTTIKLMQMRFENQPRDQAHVFVFDAWAHQGDPLRRAFLESLRSYLTENSLINGTHLHTEMEALHERHTESTSQSTPVLTFFGTTTLLSLFLIPLGAPLHANHPWIASLLTVAPILAVMCAWLSYRPTINIFRRAFWLTNRAYVPMAELFWHKTRDITTSSSISPGEPTSIEFQRLFSKLIAGALADHPNRRLIVVMDNLDRLPVDEGLQVLSTMRTFLDTNRNNHTFAERLWLIIPFNPGWAEDGANRGISVDFVEKTFQISMQIFEPPLSRWKRYLAEQLKVALPEHDGDRETILLLYDQLHKGNSALTITPRSFKHFVNQLVILHRQWKADISLSTIAAYILVRPSFANTPSQGLAAGILKSIDSAAAAIIGDKSWPRSFAALHFAVSPDEAIEILVAPEIRDALQSRNIDALAELRSLPGFLDICERVVTEQRDAWIQQPSRLASCAAVLSSISYTRQPLWATLKTAAEQVESWIFTHEDEADGIVAILSKYDASDRATRLKAFLGAFPALESPSQSTWIGVLFRLAASLTRDELEELRDTYNIRTDHHQYYLLAQDALERFPLDANGWLLMHPGVDSRVQVIALLDRDLLDGANSGKALRLLHALAKLPEDWPFNVLSTAIRSSMETDPSAMPPVWRNRLEALILLTATREAAKTDIVAICTSGRLLHQMWQNFSDPMAVGIAMFCHIMFGNDTIVGDGAQSLNRIAEIRTQPIGHESELEALLRTISTNSSLEGFLAALFERPDHDVLARIILQMADKEGLVSAELRRQLVLEKESYVRRLFAGEALDDFMGPAIHDPSLQSSLRESPFSLDRVDIYHRIISASAVEIDHVFWKFVGEGLRSIATDHWQSQLNNQGEHVQFLIRYGERTTSALMGLRFEQALKLHAESVLSGSTFPDRLASQWGILLRTLDDDPRAVLLRDVRDLLLGPGRGVSELLQLYGKELRDGGYLLEKPDDVVRHFFCSVLEAKESKALPLVLNLIDSQPEILQGAEEASRWKVNELLQALVSNADLPPELKTLAERAIAATKARDHTM